MATGRHTGALRAAASAWRRVSCCTNHAFKQGSGSARCAGSFQGIGVRVVLKAPS